MHLEYFYLPSKYNHASIPVKTENRTELENVRKYYEFFKSHEAEFENN